MGRRQATGDLPRLLLFSIIAMRQGQAKATVDQPLSQRSPGGYRPLFVRPGAAVHQHHHPGTNPRGGNPAWAGLALSLRRATGLGQQAERH